MNAFSLLEKVRRDCPVVHHITNWVTIADCAAIVKAIGGSPVMAHALEEAAQMTMIASSLVLNIGTLTVALVESMKRAAIAAREKGIPVVLDVCGAGATELRNDKCAELLETGAIGMIKGNCSEIARVAGKNVVTRGVDAAAVGENMPRVAAALAVQRSAVVVVTGKEDIVTDGRHTYLVQNGDSFMAQVVGTGCMAASVIGAFVAVAPADMAAAAAAGLVCYEIAAERAARISQGPASFKNNLLDECYRLDQAAVEKKQRVHLVAV
ncbi:MAG: hydroxyethylthiazole kinase [Candidatus Omnitrophica bacterium]|nr:hydroxyethylthiazole kinase [Candidatus Omnitrophota bacterium]